MRERVRRTLGGLGRALITIGTLTLLFVAYQVWGTGYFTAQAQRELNDEFNALKQRYASTTTARAPSTSTAPKPTTTTAPPKSSPTIDASRVPVFEDGDAIGNIKMPWGDYTIIEGTSREDLKKGPGHYPATVFPGQLGNAAIAGHRTTYLHPFLDLDTMHVGTEFKVEMLWGTYTYRVTEEPFAVTPDQVWVVATCPPSATPSQCARGSGVTKSTITLTACNPKYSARQRLIVQAELVVDKSPKPRAFETPKPKPQHLANEPDASEAASLRSGLEGEAGSKLAAFGWGLLMAAIGLLWWWVYRHWRYAFTWFVGLVPFVPTLIVFYVYLERALPAGY